MSLLVSSTIDQKLEHGDQIAVFSLVGKLVGVGSVRDGRSGLAIWGDDESTKIVEGLIKGEKFELRLWDRELNDVRELSIINAESVEYETDGFASLTVSSDSKIPEQFYLSGGYPNPFNSTTRLSYGLPVKASISVKVFDLAGRTVATLIVGEHSAGNFEVVWDSKAASAGTYLIRLESKSFNAVSKVSLIK